MAPVKLYTDKSAITAGEMLNDRVIPLFDGCSRTVLRTMKNEFYDRASRKKIYRSLEELQIDVEHWISQYSEQRPHGGKSCYGKTPIQTFHEATHLALEKTISGAALSDAERFEPAVI